MPDFEKEIVPLIRKDYETCGRPVCCDCFQRERVMVPMRDGSRLETFVYRPARGRAVYPVILNRTCYPHTDPANRVHGEEIAKRGYIYIYQYCRGTGGSEGTWKPNVNEREDGIDTVDWICSLPETGRIGVWGRSYEALTGWAMADAVEGKVTSMFLGAYGTDRFASAYEKGSFRHDVLTSWTMENAGFPVHAAYEESCRYLPHVGVDKALWGGRIDWYRDYILNENITDPYWQSGWWQKLREIPEKTRIPLYITSGWYDHHHGSSMLTWERLHPESKQHSWLEVSSLNHFQFPCVEGRPLVHDKKKDLKHLFEWFDLTLLQGKLPKQEQWFYEIGADCWQEWTGSVSDRRAGAAKTFYLSVAEDDGKCLTEKAAGQRSAVSYVYDPQDPVRTCGGDALLHTAAQIGSILQPEPDYRPDVKSFLSEPMEKTLDIFGKIRVKLWICSDCEDTAFTAKLCEVFPDGRTYHIRSSITTIAASRGADDYIPGTPVEVEIEMWDIFYQIRVGNQLRLDISSSDFPQYNIHTNYRGKWALQEKTKKADQTIFCGGRYDSQVIIPLVTLEESPREP